MKERITLLLMICFIQAATAQLIVHSSASVVIDPGSSVIVIGSLTSDNGSFINDGTLEIKGDLENNSSGLITSASTGAVKFTGSSAQKISGSYDAEFYGTLEINNSSGVSIDTNATGNGSHQSVDTLVFTAGLLTLNWFNLNLKADAITPGSGKYIQTDSTGVVTRNVPADGSTNVVFPVGKSAYNPLVLQNSATATADNYSVRVVDAEPAASSTNHMVDRSWEVTEGTPGGSELTVTAKWNSTEELTSFDRDNAAIGLTTDAGSSYEWANTDAATGSDPYTLAGSTFAGVGTFTVGDYFYSGKQLDLTLFLGGAYNGSTMDNDLYTDGLIPTTDPYGLSTTVTTVPSNAVDWVKVELRDNGDHSTIQHSYAFFVDASGNLLNTDGTTGGKITGAVLQNYYIAVLHRNHMGIISSAIVNLDASSPSYDFTTALSKAWDDAAVTTNDAMKNVSGVFCLWEGDATDNGEVAYNGASNDRLGVLTEVGSSTPGNTVTDTYSDNDVNMDGDVIYNGAGSDRVSILTVVGSSTPGVVYKVHLP